MASSEKVIEFGIFSKDFRPHSIVGDSYNEDIREIVWARSWASVMPISVSITANCPISIGLIPSSTRSADVQGCALTPSDTGSIMAPFLKFDQVAAAIISTATTSV